MQERDASAVGASARYLVHEAQPRGTARGEALVQVGHAQAEVVDARAAPREKSCNRARGVVRFEELNRGVAEREAHDGRTVSGFPAPGREAENVPVERKGAPNTRHRNADMGDARPDVRHKTGS